ncbi:uncharacterized protein LOC134842542 [Symsagittifera roscoffensis]|uniref:uncharacterized protein LOC134842542 n=1 Tax=Symsagittifera roscoffensis TaxID=84072 RepID=UPI00307C6BF0
MNIIILLVSLCVSIFFRNSVGAVDTPSCKESLKCDCMIDSVRCVMLSPKDDDVDKITSEFTGLAVSQSDVVFRKLNPHITYLDIQWSDYSFLNNEPVFSNLRTFQIFASKYRGFPRNNITELRIDNGLNLRGKSLQRVLKNISREFPNVQTLELENMGLTFDERDARAKPVKFANLVNVSLKGNRISSLLVLNSIEGWWRMKEIRLNDNYIDSVSLGDIKQIASFEFEPDARVKLRMDQQRGLLCECGLNGFQKWLKATELFINPTSIKCQMQTERSNAQLESLLDLNNLCQKSRKSTAVALHGVGKMKGSVAALIVTGSVVGIIAMCVIFCHHRKLGKTAKNMQQMRNTPTYQGGRPR